MKASFNFGYLESHETEMTPTQIMTVGAIIALGGIAGIVVGGYGILGVIGGAIFGVGLNKWQLQRQTFKATDEAVAEAKAAGEPIFARGVHAAEAPGNASWANPHVGGGGAGDGHPGATGGSGQ